MHIVNQSNPCGGSWLETQRKNTPLIIASSLKAPPHCRLKRATFRLKENSWNLICVFISNLGNSAFYANCMLFLPQNVIFVPLIVSRKRPAVLNFSYGRGWGGGLRGAGGHPVTCFCGGRASNSYKCIPFVPLICYQMPIEDTFLHIRRSESNFAQNHI